MVDVSFYTNVADRLPYVCRLLRKAHMSGVRMGVVGPAQTLELLDSSLWTFESTEFVPHMRMGQGLAANAIHHTPVLLAERVEELADRKVLLNLGVEVPEGYASFSRVLEVVSRDAQQMQLGRLRFRRYRDDGCQVAHHVISD